MNCAVLPDAGKDVLKGAPFGDMGVDIIGRDNWQEEFFANAAS